MYSITTHQAPPAKGCQSQGASAARFVFVSAQEPLDPISNEQVLGSVQARTNRALMNVEAILHQANVSLQDVCKLTIYLTNMRDLEAVDATLSERFSRPYPARTVLQVSGLPSKSSLAIEAVACK